MGRLEGTTNCYCRESLGLIRLACLAGLLTKVWMDLMFIAAIPGIASKKVGQNVKEQRESKGWSVTQLAFQMGENGHQIERTQISKIEHGHAGISIDRLLAFAEVFSIQPQTLLREPGWSKFPWSSVIERQAV